MIELKFTEQRKELHKLHIELGSSDLVEGTSGNISMRIIDNDLCLIKPSGVKYGDLTPENMVLIDFDGNVIEGTMLPSTDTETHLHIYKNREDVNGVVHTHSVYATAFAAVGLGIPACLTEIADEFGHDIPCSKYAPIGGVEMAKAALETMGKGHAVLLKSHGVITTGVTSAKALKASLMLEHSAKIVFIAKQLGEPSRLDQKELERAHERYATQYGQ